MLNFFKKIKVLIFTLFIIFCASFQLKSFSQVGNFTNFQPFKVAFIPDMHMSFDKKDDWILYNESLVILQDTIKTLNKRSDIDFTIFGGNLLENNDKKLSDLPMLLDSLNDLKNPYYVILGDREADLDESLTKQDFCVEFRRYGFSDKERTYWANEPKSGVLLIGLDSSQNNRFSGALSQDQLVWLDETLNSNRDKFTVIAIHHPVLPSCEQDKVQPWSNYVLTNSGDFLNIINKYPQVKLVLSGHHNINKVQNINGKLFMNLPSPVVYPNEFKVLSVYPDRVETENIPISFKQIINKSKKLIINSDYAKQYNPDYPKQVINLQEGDAFTRKNVFYFNGQGNAQ